MFTQLEIKDNVNQNGIGFGLTISKMIIEKIGGSLSIKTNCPSSISDNSN
jgi:C4-dicarboxylate-specific signal transduction histidine kinase